MVALTVLIQNVLKVLFHVAITPEYGKTLDEAKAEKIRLDNEAVSQEG